MSESTSSGAKVWKWIGTGAAIVVVGLLAYWLTYTLLR